MINKIWELATPQSVSVVTAETSILPLTIDLFSAYNAGDIASIELEILTGATAPGAARTLTMYAAFSSNPTRTPAELSTNSANAIFAIPNSTNTRRVFSLPVYQQGARYLTIWYDHTVMDAGSILTLSPVVNAKTG